MYTKEVERLTNEINSVRSVSELSKITNYERDKERLEEIDRILWALENGYYNGDLVIDYGWHAVLLVTYYWCITVAMIPYGGGL